MKRYLKTPEEVIEALQKGKVYQYNLFDGELIEYQLIKGIIVARLKEDNSAWRVGDRIEAIGTFVVEGDKELEMRKENK